MNYHTALNHNHNSNNSPIIINCQFMPGYFIISMKYRLCILYTLLVYNTLSVNITAQLQPKTLIIIYECQWIELITKLINLIRFRRVV